MANGFIKNYKILDETYRVDDLLDISATKERFKNKILSIEHPSIIGLIGKFGSGKSTMIYQLEKELSEDSLWINFDAWKYPDRRDMWEGLVIEFAETVNKRDEVINIIDATPSDEKKRVNIYTEIAKTLSPLYVFEAIKKIYDSLSENSPIKRLFEMQELFKKLIEKINKDIYIVMEDVDRSGDYGLYLLETLKEFVRKVSSENQFVIIVPIGDERYAKNIDAYLKCLDYIDNFTLTDIKLDKFFQKIIGERELVETEIGSNRYLISEYFEYLLLHNKDITIRTIKTILRKADINYKVQISDGYSARWFWTVLFESAKYIKVPIHSSKDEYLASKFRREMIIDEPDYFKSALWGSEINRSIYMMGSDQRINGRMPTIKIISYDGKNNDTQDKILTMRELLHDGKAQESYALYDHYLKY